MHQQRSQFIQDTVEPSYLPGINSLFIECIGIIRHNSSVGGRARAESNPGHWVHQALLHMAAESVNHSKNTVLLYQLCILFLQNSRIQLPMLSYGVGCFSRKCCGIVMIVMVNTLQVLIFGSLLICYRSVPLLQLPEEWVFPCGYILAFPSGIPGKFNVSIQICKIRWNIIVIICPC